VETLELLRLVLARDVARPLALGRWDAAAWEAVHRAVVAWDAAPLTYGAVCGAGLRKDVPPWLLAEWRKDHTQTTAVNLRLAFEASAVTAALAREGVRAAPLKGTALFLLGVYRDPGARPTNDVDMLIDPAGGATVDRVLLARGFERSRAGGPKHWPPYLRDGLMVEVHEHAFWSLSDGHRVGLPEMLGKDARPTLDTIVAHLLHHLFESSVTTPWLIVKTLADLAEALAFCPRDASPEGNATSRTDSSEGIPTTPATSAPIHPRPAHSSPSTSHSTSQLARDIAETAPRIDLAHQVAETAPRIDLAHQVAETAPRIDLAHQIADTAHRFGLSRRLGALAGLLARVLERPVPEAWMRGLRPGDVDALLRRCAPRSRRFEQALRLPDRALAFARMPLSEKTAILRYHFFPPAEAMRALYGLPPGSRWVWPLYPLRPGHLLVRSALDAARLLVPKGAGRRGPGRADRPG